ncbi:MAG: beta-hydroxyacyl-ACP dehydratase [Candidatus Aureabacteria bacterium]|nr:beta-hydroxyacyl-ACP dehydratase [Candidatus Auribacterota bacterium]
MRWIHIDDILELREGEFAKAVRTIPSDADFLQDHYPGFPVVPQSLLIESMAQTAGILLGKSFHFTRDVILAKIDNAEFFTITKPGELLLIEARMAELRDEGARLECRITCDGKEVGRSSLVFALLGDQDMAKLGARNFVFHEGVLERFRIRSDP